MKAKLFMTMAAATMILAGCSNDENEITDNWNGEIRLSSGVTVQTRSNTQATQIQQDETVYVWADKASSTTEYIKAWTLTADGSNGFKAAIWISMPCMETLHRMHLRKIPLNFLPQLSYIR